MRRIAAVLTVAAVAISASVVAAQSKPSFAGKWVMDPASAPQGGGGGGRGRGGMGGGWGQTFTLTQDATTIKVERTAGETPITETYKLDGSESKNSMPGRQGGASGESVSKATWDGAKLVITTIQTMDFNGNETRIDMKRVLSKDGADLAIETTRSNPMGGDPVVSTVKYKKG
jgi:hypothetical protein